jgi:hypothetical protein
MTIKILTICDYGQIRSVGMKVYLNGLQRHGKNRIDKLEYDVIPIGSITSSKETILMLKQWADIVIDMRNWLEDKYGSCWDEELRKECENIWAEVCSYPKYKFLFKCNDLQNND